MQESPTTRRKTASPRPAPLSRKRIVSRLWRTAERQVAEIETRMSAIDGDQQALEREAKTLAIIAKTVRDLVAIDADAALGARTGKAKDTSAAHGNKLLPPADAAADAVARSRDEFRAELARRLDELRRERGGRATP